MCWGVPFGGLGHEIPGAESHVQFCRGEQSWAAPEWVSLHSGCHWQVHALAPIEVMGKFLRPAEKCFDVGWPQLYGGPRTETKADSSGHNLGWPEWDLPSSHALVLLGSLLYPISHHSLLLVCKAVPGHRGCCLAHTKVPWQPFPASQVKRKGILASVPVAGAHTIVFFSSGCRNPSTTQTQFSQAPARVSPMPKTNTTIHCQDHEQLAKS